MKSVAGEEGSARAEVNGREFGMGGVDADKLGGRVLLGDGLAAESDDRGSIEARTDFQDDELASTRACNKLLEPFGALHVRGFDEPAAAAHVHDDLATTVGAHGNRIGVGYFHRQRVDLRKGPVDERPRRPHLLGATGQALEPAVVALGSIDLARVEAVLFKHAVGVGCEHKVVLGGHFAHDFKELAWK